ncbi:uncharacterized protein LOC100378079, partial [Saccoglossus kowalevskii]|uniref:Uncharacterized protein LOC100378079 n=1 Tax=Saccoglossus kowalevskii TaxID=10224 RepID=A0ABM0GT44_SACKO
LFVEASSNGFAVDETPPNITTPAAFDASQGSFMDNTQTWRSLIKVTWDVSDQESHIDTQSVSIFTHQQSELDIDPVKVNGGDREYTFTDLSLKDGYTYYAKVISCNRAKLCTSSISQGLLVDSTPPTVGMFAVDTEHAADLARHRDGWMTYNLAQASNPAQINIAWLGFADIHSGISNYFITVGTYFSGNDLTLNGPIRVDYAGGTTHYDEGVIQTAMIDVNRDITPGEHIYVSIWAVNGVGLRSYEAHDTFEVVSSNTNSGILSLLRRCSAQSCQGDCTCAPQNQLCHETTGCIDVTGDESYQQVEIVDVTEYRKLDGSIFEDKDYTPSKCSLAAKWRTLSGGSQSVIRYEWSAGSKDDQPGSSVLDVVFDRVWHDVGLETNAVLMLEKNKFALEPNVIYVFYVKAWYNSDTYAIFQSDGMESDSTPPAVSTSRKVKDVVDLNNILDIDFTTSTNSVGVSWRNVFIDVGGIAHFSVSLSTYIGGEDVSSFNSNTVTNSVFEVQLTSLSLLEGVKYYSNVRAINNAGLYITASSDGFIVDNTVPTTGVVYDGFGLHDAEYQNITDTISASWHGFSDLQSYISHYLWCVGSSPGAEDIVACENVGLQLSASKSAVLSNGQKCFSQVTAIDVAGLHSVAAVSNGVVIDDTAPNVEERFSFGANVLRNPSFEDIHGWIIDGNSEIKSQSQYAQNGDSFLLLYGEVHQSFQSVIGSKYQVIFYTSHIYSSSTPLLSQEGFIQLPESHHVFPLYQRPGRQDSHQDIDNMIWQRHVFYFIAMETSSTITIGSVGLNNGIAIDNVQVRYIGLGPRDPPAIPNLMNQLSSPVHVETLVQHEWNSVHARWHAVDVESPIVDFMWAIGTVQGGTQLQGFTSVGRNTHGDKQDLILNSGSSIHVTVVILNAAGLRSVIYSDAILVDLTPPQLCCIKDGDGDDLIYQSANTIKLNWLVTDDESGVDYCEWAIGLTPGSAEIQAFERTDTLISSESELSVTHGQTLFSTVRCQNYDGLQSQITSNGVTIVTEPPNTDHAIMSLTTSSVTQYPTRGYHQAQTDAINIAWQGFNDITGIEYYECKILGDDVDTSWYKVGDNGHLFTVMKGLMLSSYKTYQVYLKAVNYAGFESDVLVSNITVETEAPITRNADLQSVWPHEWEMTFDWTDVFSSNSSMIYEVTIGTAWGGMDVLKWTETTDTHLRMTGVNHALEHYVAITAINEAGLYSTKTFVVSYS